MVIQCRSQTVSRDLVSHRMRDDLMSDLRIFSYLPNPRIWKATIAGAALRRRGRSEGQLAERTTVMAMGL